MIDIASIVPNTPPFIARRILPLSGLDSLLRNFIISLRCVRKEFAVQGDVYPGGMVYSPFPPTPTWMPHPRSFPRAALNVAVTSLIFNLALPRIHSEIF